jgi:SOS-response transcriptional repressor LexA
MVTMEDIKSGYFPFCQVGIVPIALEPTSGKNPGMARAKKSELVRRVRSDLIRRIDERLEATKMVASSASVAAGLNSGYIRDIDRKKAVPTIDMVEQLAIALETTPEWLAFGVGSSAAPRFGLPVKHEVAAGNWLEVEGGVDANKFDPVPIAFDPRYPASAQFAVVVRGTSINRIAQPGDFLVCIDIEALGYEMGDLVIVERRNQESAREMTAKRVRREGGQEHLFPDSDDPQWQNAIPLTDKKTKDGTTVAVIAVVSGVWRPIRGR